MSIYNPESSFLLDAMASEWCSSIDVLPLNETDVSSYLDANPDVIVRYLQERVPLAESLLKTFFADLFKAPESKTAESKATESKVAEFNAAGRPDAPPAEESLSQNLFEDDWDDLFPGIQLDNELFVDDVQEARRDVNEYQAKTVVPSEIEIHHDAEEHEAEFYEEQQDPIVVSDDESDEESEAEADQDDDNESFEGCNESADEYYDQESLCESEEAANQTFDQNSDDEYVEDFGPDYARQSIEESDEANDESDEEANKDSDNDSDCEYNETNDKGSENDSDDEENEETPQAQAGYENGARRASYNSRVSPPLLDPSVRMTPDSPVVSPPRSPPAPARTPPPSPPARARARPKASKRRQSRPERQTRARSTENEPPMPFPAPDDLVDKSRKQPEGKKWRLFEEEACIAHMINIRDEGRLKGEARFAEAQRRMEDMDGIVKNGRFAVKNFWNRVGRARSGFDERKNKKAPLATSKQGRNAEDDSTTAPSTSRKRKASSTTNRKTQRKRRARSDSDSEDDDDVDVYKWDSSDQSEEARPVKSKAKAQAHSQGRNRKRTRDDDSEDDWQPDEATINALQKGLRAPKKSRSAY
ncbi:hypothetical protein A1O1_05255 [Capronia coronata CBS 617.96]|uniref:Uncharacterized protein n=1 Tax=Capronia coronata CBS 617.96 TaxID=1182541 RepID=W9YF75_9EURO|nr:uncharacterized protein A1O1_05255 [Capronia coronata CBS 617.96]EXJ88325.1 hypothetical protein A1O1_05255 [Capronia coronata CBS 617.96]